MTSRTFAARARARDRGASPAAVARPPPAPRGTIAVVTHDDALADALRRATPDRSVMVVATPFALADLLLQEHTSVVVLDLAVPGDHGARLVDHLAAQFPELQLIAVGRREDEAALAPALTSGRLFRFMHRPFSVARARTFVEAALERHGERRPRAPDDRLRHVARVGFVVAAGLLALALVPVLRTPAPQAGAATVAVHAAAAPPVRPDTHPGRPARAPHPANRPATAVPRPAPVATPGDPTPPAS